MSNLKWIYLISVFGWTTFLVICCTIKQLCLWKIKMCNYLQPDRSSNANKYTKLQHRPCPLTANHQWSHLSVFSTVICHLKPSPHGNLIYRMRFFTAMKWRFNIDNYTGSSPFKLWLVNSSQSSLISESAPSTLIFPVHSGKSIILTDSGINSWGLCLFPGTHTHPCQHVYFFHYLSIHRPELENTIGLGTLKCLCMWESSQLLFIYL